MFISRLNFFSAFTARPSILHQLPGRIRIRLPWAKYLPQGFEFEQFGITPYESQMPYLLRGIRSISLNKVSANALIYYDTNETNAEEIVEKITWLYQIISEYGEQFQRLSAADKDHVLTLFMKYLSELTPEAFKAKKLPDHILSRIY